MTVTRLYTNFIYPIEVADVAKLFFDHVELSNNDIADIVHSVEVDKVIVSRCQCGGIVESCTIDNVSDLIVSMRLQKRVIKMSVYNCLVKVTGKRQPWGCLTGIRPTRLAYQLMQESSDYRQVFLHQYDVSQHNIDLVDTIIANQQSLRIIDDNVADMYIGVPFCKTRCSYCSFTSGELSALHKYVEPYVDTLIYDIEQSQAMAKRLGIRLNNLYIGGGTPTTLTAEQLDRVMSAINFVPMEYCVEAGRPDTIDKDKLAVMAQHNVDRISINPQSFDDKVLTNIGRAHSSQDIIDCYNLAKQFNFVINMDFIAGLPGDSFEGFCKSIDKAIELSPDNITVHTLAIKQGSILAQIGVDSQDNVVKMVDYARAKLQDNGYMPYYMYRQKYMTNNLENVGYCKQDKQCRYNINIMEETSNIIACGTNAISKRVFSLENRIERSANAKDVISYINNIDTYLAKKEKLFNS